MSVSIPFDKLEEGIKKSLENAGRCLEDAVLLFHKERYQSSILLSMLSYEESGKTMMLIDHKNRKDEITKNQWNKKFRYHTKKIRKAMREILEKWRTILP